MNTIENLDLTTNGIIAFQSFDADHPDGKKHSTVFNSLLVCYHSTHLLIQICYEGNLSFWHFHGKANDCHMMSHDVKFYMKYSTVFSPVITIIQTRIEVLRVLPDN